MHKYSVQLAVLLLSGFRVETLEVERKNNFLEVAVQFYIISEHGPPPLAQPVLSQCCVRLPFIKIKYKVSCKACVLVYWQMRGTELHSCSTYKVWKTPECQKMSCLLVSHLLCLLNFDFKINMLWYVLVKTDACLQKVKLVKLLPCILGKPNFPHFSPQKTEKFQATKWLNNCDISFARLVCWIKKWNEKYFQAK